MRKLVVCNIMSLDGDYAERLRAADTLLLGANAHRGFKGFWPPMADNPDGPAVVGGGTPVFGTRPPGRLRLAEARRFDGSDNLLLR